VSGGALVAARKPVSMSTERRRQQTKSFIQLLRQITSKRTFSRSITSFCLHANRRKKRKKFESKSRKACKSVFRCSFKVAPINQVASSMIKRNKRLIQRNIVRIIKVKARKLPEEVSFCTPEQLRSIVEEEVGEGTRKMGSR
jgi:hypothetical protein